ncbi:abhydrolase domain-containing protein 5 [Strigomonas culicis]|uniref:Abhydrolase domain-containing protein 5 n=1 Tax=Strigomonas culicis TaxID=28005 RepID=S9UND7_9TRYP|nr:abhydrolase domain-containing protein 5 [Strigomonas culicis]|eukprot:EPY32382.1 abhydrolase domain-containing protein 5 [Strigomonas culicis]
MPGIWDGVDSNCETVFSHQIGQRLGLRCIVTRCLTKDEPNRYFLAPVRGHHVLKGLCGCDIVVAAHLEQLFSHGRLQCVAVIDIVVHDLHVAQEILPIVCEVWPRLAHQVWADGARAAQEGEGSVRVEQIEQKLVGEGCLLVVLVAATVHSPRIHKDEHLHKRRVAAHREVGGDEAAEGVREQYDRRRKVEGLEPAVEIAAHHIHRLRQVVRAGLLTLAACEARQVEGVDFEPFTEELPVLRPSRDTAAEPVDQNNDITVILLRSTGGGNVLPDGLPLRLRAHSALARIVQGGDVLRRDSIEAGNAGLIILQLLHDKLFGVRELIGIGGYPVRLLSPRAPSLLHHFWSAL